MRPRVLRLGYACARSRLLREESGIALIMAIGIMLVLTIVLTTVISLTAASARDAQRTNAGQKAYALAEAGISNALAVLNANYPTTIPFPGDYSLLSGAGAGEANCGVSPAGCISTYASGTATWNGSLVAASATVPWKYEWHLTSAGAVKNPTGPGAADVTRKATALVPVVIPDTSSINPRTSSLNTIFGYNVTFAQGVQVAAPVYATNDLDLEGTATIHELIPASVVTPATPNRLLVGRNVIQNNTGIPNQNHIGHVQSTSYPGSPTPTTTSADKLGEVHISGRCQVGSSSLHTCVLATPTVPGDYIFTNSFDTTTSGLVVPPTFTCCASGDPGRTVSYASPVDGVSHPATPSYVGFWYNNSDFGPSSPCATYVSTGLPASGPELRFDNASTAPSILGRDGTLNQSATAGAPAFNLTPSGGGYDCRSVDGLKQFAWNGTGSTWRGIPTNTLIVQGVVFIDGSATADRGNSPQAKYTGKGAIILTGTFLMPNQAALCVNVPSSGGGCDTAAQWDPDKAGLFIGAAGDFGTDRSSQGTGSSAGISILIKKAQYQGGLIGLKKVDANVTGTNVQGPMISAYDNVSAGQSGILTFPPLSFPSSGNDGLTGPFPKAHLLAPRQFGGS